MLDVVDYAQRSHFDVIDITGGAPELNPHVEELIEQMAALVPRVMFRSNLSASEQCKKGRLDAGLEGQPGCGGGLLSLPECHPRPNPSGEKAFSISASRPC